MTLEIVEKYRSACCFAFVFYLLLTAPFGYLVHRSSEKLLKMCLKIWSENPLDLEGRQWMLTAW